MEMIAIASAFRCAGYSKFDVKSLFMTMDPPIQAPGDAFWKYSALYNAYRNHLEAVLSPGPKTMICETRFKATTNFIFEHFIQDVAYGSREFKFRELNGSEISLHKPNWVITKKPKEIYENYARSVADDIRICETTFNVILNMISQRQSGSLAGLDNIANDGKEGLSLLIENLGSLLDDDLDAVRNVRVILENARDGLKEHLQDHIKPDNENEKFVHNECCHHCVPFAFHGDHKSCDKDVVENAKQKKKYHPTLSYCNEPHRISCNFCESYEDTLDFLSIRIPLCSNLDECVKKELMDNLEYAKLLRGHYVRSIVQRHQQQKIMKNLEFGQVFIILDWAMKFLALLYREKMELFFAKAGINWHESICFFKDEGGQIQTVSFTHLSDNTTQDAQTVASILGDVLSQLKTKYPYLKTGTIQSDNAGCYRSFDFIIPSVIYGLKTGILVTRFVFSEAQDGKNACDRVLATKKGLLGSFVDSNEGNILRASDIMEALYAMKNNRSLKILEQLQSCVVFEPNQKIDLDIHVPGDIKIRRLSDFQLMYREDGLLELLVQEQSEIGPKYSCVLNLNVKEGDKRLPSGTVWIKDSVRKSISVNNLRYAELCGPFTNLGPSNQEPEKKRRKKELQQAVVFDFSCGTPGCMKTYPLNKIPDPETCVHKFPQRTLRDMLGTQLQSIIAGAQNITENIIKTFATHSVESLKIIGCQKPLSPGNCLKPPHTVGSIPDAVKQMCHQLFLEGLNPDGTINKSKKYSAEMAMDFFRQQCALGNLDGANLPKKKQIMSIFSRLATQVNDIKQKNLEELPLGPI